MKNQFLSIMNAKVLSKKEQKNIQGGIWGSGGSCMVTGCDHGRAFVGFEGGPCGLESPTPESCVGTVRNGKCCIGSFH